MDDTNFVFEIISIKESPWVYISHYVDKLGKVKNENLKIFEKPKLFDT